jgi:hypothetical protein
VAQVERRVSGFVCASDPNATAGIFTAPVSYRATTGDAADGSGGAFAVGRRSSLTQIEAADGLSYTAGFSERLVGDNQAEHPAVHNYAGMPGPLSGTGCPSAAPGTWRGDAGSSWVCSNWQSTLYHHALVPNAQPSCIATDRLTAFMGASSGHVEAVNLLLLDGSVRTFTPAVDLKIWREWASTPEAPRETIPAPARAPAPFEEPRGAAAHRGFTSASSFRR